MKNELKLKLKLILKVKYHWCGIVCMILHLTVFIQYQHVTDRQTYKTNRQMDGHMITANTVIAQQGAVIKYKTLSAQHRNDPKTQIKQFEVMKTTSAGAVNK